MLTTSARLTLAVLAATVTSGAALPATNAMAARHHKRPAKVHVHHVSVVLGGSPIGRGGDPGDDYPTKWKNAAQDSTLDNWGEYNRECTSFAAWALASRDGFNMPFHDNANAWGARARALGYRVDSSPATGSIAWSNAGKYGHVAFVTGVGDGTVSIEEYNEYGNGKYSARTVAASAFTGYIHFADAATAAPAAAPVVAPTSAPAPSAPIQGSSTPIQGSSTPIQGSSTPIQGSTSSSNGGDTATSTPTPMPVATTPAFNEQQGHNGVNTFNNPFNASGMGPRVDPGATVQISCRVYAPQIASANPDGWWYRIHSSPWNDQYYSPANTFMNGDPWTGPYTHNTDFSVPSC